MKVDRKIIHIDMDAFFASVEQRDNISLRGKCVVVGGAPNSRGVVCAASYEARKFGVKSAMASSKAYKLCPHAIFISPNFGKYKEVSLELRKIFSDYTNLIEPLSLDEAYLDVTENYKNQLSATIIAKEIQSRVSDELELSASCGVAPNKLVAKIASDYNKPKGFLVVRPNEVRDFMADLLVEKVPGVGKATLIKLKELNIEYCKDLMRFSLPYIEKRFGKFGRRLYLFAQGIDNRPVKPYRETKSIASENTLAQDTLDISTIQKVLKNEIFLLVKRLESKQLSGKTVTLKVKYYDFTQVTRSITLTRPISTLEGIFEICNKLIKNTLVGKKKVRLIGVSMSNFKQENPRQLLLDF